MNNQIQKFAEQAGMYVGLKGKPWPKCMSTEECEAAYEKFAQLIVQECAKIVTDAVDHCEPASTYADKIKQHFGVNNERTD